eukprot:2550813-Rhodomonas_salina.3
MGWDARYWHRVCCEVCGTGIAYVMGCAVLRERDLRQLQGLCDPAGTGVRYWPNAWFSAIRDTHMACGPMERYRNSL